MKQLFFFLVSIFMVSGLLAQPTKEELQRRNQELTREIEEIRSTLNDNTKDKKSLLAVRVLLERKIEARNQIIANIKGEVYYIEKDIIRNYREIDTLKKELDTLKSQYAKSIVYAYRNRSNYDFLNFLFSASSFNDALKRIEYLKTYRQYREVQAGQIKKTDELLTKKIAALSGKRADKGKALVEQSKQMNEMEVDKKKKDQALAQLQAKERELSGTIKRKEKQKQDVARQIKKIIDDELAKARRIEQEKERIRIKRFNDSLALAKLKNPTATDKVVITKPPAVVTRTPSKRPVSELENTPEGLITSTEFEKNRGNLPWPVEKGTVTLRFGVNSIPAKPRPINVYSDGITVEVGVGSAVKSIFDGEISSVSTIADKTLIIVKHGKYFTAYSNLESASVSKGQKINRGEVIGRAGNNDEGVGEMELLITNEKGTYLNPESWIRHR